MKFATTVTRPAHLFEAVGFALLLAGCSEQPAAPGVVRLAPATVGSIVRSNVVTTTTVCLKPDNCQISTRISEIKEKVADPRSPQLRAALAIGDNAEGAANHWETLGQISNIHTSGRNLSLDIAKNGKVWHLEMTHDAVATGKVSSVRLSLNGQPLIAQNAKWKDVSGAWYREHSDMSVFNAGHLAARSEKTYTPTEVLPPDASDHSMASLTLHSPVNFTPSFVCGTEIIPDGSDGCGSSGGCPEEYYPICEWFQAGNNPLPILSGIVGELGNIVQGISNFFVSLWAGDDGFDLAMQNAELVSSYMEAYVQPNLYNIALAIGASASGGASSTLLQALGEEMIEWLTDAGVLFFL